MSPKYRFLLALLLTLVAICSQVVFAQTKTITQKVQVGLAYIGVQLKSLHHQSCTTSGTIDITASGGTAPYTFVWTGPANFKANTEDISNLNAGTYSVMVFDANGCSYTSSWSITSTCVSGCNLTDVSSITNASSCLSTNGSITVTINGGTGSYGYTWYNSAFNIISNTKNLTGVPAGDYYLEVTDLNNTSCVSFFYYTVSTPFKLNTSITGNTSCKAPYTGAINASATGGSGSYTFTLTHPSGKTSTSATPSFTGLSGGSYKLAVQDNVGGCKAERSLFVSTASSFPLTITETVTPLTSCSPPNGAIQVTISNGSGTYSYSWLNQNTGSIVSVAEDLTSADASTYMLYVQDPGSGCNASKKLTIENKTVAPAFVSSITPSTSCTEPNGMIDVSMTTVGDYAFDWSPLAASSEDVTGLSPGEYQLTITDLSTGCSSANNSFLVEDQNPEQVNVIVNNVNPNTNCSAPNGSILVTVTSNALYSLNWSGIDFSSGNEDLVALDSGTYILTATINCNQAPVIEPPKLTTVGGGTIVTLNLEDIVIDPDNNLDLSAFEILEQPKSGARARIDNTLLQLEYDSDYRGTDNMRIQACDLMDACTEQVLTLQVDVSAEVIVFNAIAPNGAGDNQFMRIENLPSQNRVSIFNRWGDPVFSVNNYASAIPGQRFEGRSNTGSALPSGTYFYKIELDQQAPITGYLSLKQ